MMIGGVAWHAEEDLPEATACANTLGLPLMPWLQAQGLVVLIRAGRAGLARAGDRPSPVECAWGDAELQRRYRASIHKDALARACGLDAAIKPSIVDGTGGFGRDSWLLAAWGSRVRVIERDKAMSWLLRRAWLQETRKNTAIGQRMRVHETDFVDFCHTLSDVGCDLVYLDPMFPSARNKKTKSGKRMDVLQTAFVEDEQPEQEILLRLLRAALSCTRYRVVLKRPKAACAVPALSIGEKDCKPHQITGSSSRFDIYVRRGLPR